MPLACSDGEDYISIMRIQLLFPPSPIVRELCHRGHHVWACGVGFSEEEIAHFNGRLKLYPIGVAPKLSKAAIAAIRSEIISFRPDVIQAYTPFGLAWANLASTFLPKSMKRPKVISFRGITKRVARLDPSNLLTFYYPALKWHACESIAIQDSMVRSGFKRSCCPVVYSSSPLYPSQKHAEELRADWKIPEGAFLFGSVVSIRPVKGIDILLEAMSLLESENIRLAVIGDGTYPALEKWLRHPKVQSRVRMLGRMGGASQYMHAFDGFVMPSRSEGLCRALIEAMQVGLPCIVSDAGGMKELVRHGKEGYVVPKENPKALAAAMEQMVASGDRGMMSESCKTHIQTMCSPQVVTSKLLQVYEAALGVPNSEPSV